MEANAGKPAESLSALPPPAERAGLAPWVAALAGFLLGSLAGILIRTPEGYASDASLLGFVGGGLAGAIVGGSVARVVGGRLGPRLGSLVGSMSGFAAGAGVGMLSGPVATAFRTAVVPGTVVPGSDVLPALYSGFATAATGVCLLDILWLTQLRQEASSRPGARLVLGGALFGAILAALGGSLTGAFVQLAAGNPFDMADASAAGRALLASWVGAGTGAAVAGLAAVASRARGASSTSHRRRPPSRPPDG